MTAQSIHCERCGYTWEPRAFARSEQNKDRPVACPACRSRIWDKPRKQQADKEIGK